MAVEKKVQCPECRENGRDSKGDNLIFFDNGTSFCFNCNKNTAGNEEETTTEQTMLNAELISGQYKELINRNISVETCIKYGYMVGHGCHIANFFDVSGNIAMQKIRYPNKEFKICGDTAQAKELYGNWLFTSDSRVFITITEGELDCLSIAEAFNCRYPVVSLPNGAQSAEAVMRRHLDYLQGFKYVVLAFDNDEPGREAVKNCLSLFEPGKVRIAKWPQKDASDLLQEGKKREIQSVIYNAVEYMPEPIKTGAELVKTLDNYKSKTKEWPWKTANRQISPINIPAIYTIAAKPAVGKTLFCSELMKSVINDGGKVGIIALEETIQKVLLKMTSAMYNMDLLGIRNRELTDEEKEMCGKVAENIVIYDHITYGSDITQICNNIPYMVRSCGCELIIFDNLSYSATGLAGNERVGIDKAMVQLKDSTVKYEYTLLNVCHLKRDDNTLGDYQPITAEAIRGSQGVEMYSDYIIGLDRNKSSEDLTIRNTLSIHILKDRMSGQDTGKIFNLFYNKKTGRLEDMEGVLS